MRPIGCLLSFILLSWKPDPNGLIRRESMALEIVSEMEKTHFARE